jgi:hypothetical protein
VRKGIASRISAAIRAIFGRAVACALIIVLASRLTAAAVSSDYRPEEIGFV